jgi:hypothetical protein
MAVQQRAPGPLRTFGLWLSESAPCWLVGYMWMPDYEIDEYGYERPSGGQICYLCDRTAEVAQQ